MPHGLTADDLADTVAAKIEFEGPDTVAAVIMEPVQNAGGCFTPPEGYWQRVREICDRYNVLLISDEVICAWGRLGEWFGAQRYDYLPDIITTAKGLTSAYAPMGAMIATDRVAEPFMDGTNSFTHGFTFAGHPICSAVALANLDVDGARGHHRERPHQRGRVPGRCSSRCATSRSSATSAAPGTSTRSSWSRTRTPTSSGQTRSPRRCCAGSSPASSTERGLICRADDRGDPVIQLSPPLIAGPKQFEEIESILRPVLTEAGERMRTLAGSGHVRPGSRPVRPGV